MLTKTILPNRRDNAERPPGLLYISGLVLPHKHIGRLRLVRVHPIFQSATHERHPQSIADDQQLGLVGRKHYYRVFIHRVEFTA
jgi:hypothetical protein